MNTNRIKINSIKVCRKRKEILVKYRLSNKTVPEVEARKYEGVSVRVQISHATIKLTLLEKPGGFVMRTLNRASRKAMSVAYQSLACPIMEYGAAYWYSYLLTRTRSLERIQRTAAKFVNMKTNTGIGVGSTRN